MIPCDPSAGRFRRFLDRVAIAWIALAPVVVTLGLLTGAVEIPTLAQVEPDEPVAHPATRAAVSLPEVGAGELLWKSPDGLVPLPVLECGVRIDVTGMMVHGRVTQSFENVFDEVIETVYVFPLPESAAVHAMEMRIGDRRIVAVVREREEAKKTYEAARKAGKKAALVEQDRPNLFTTTAANINPGETVQVVLDYVHELTWTDGAFHIAFPLTFTPRFMPFAPSQDPAGVSAAVAADYEPRAVNRILTPFVPASDPRVPRASVEVRLRAGVGVEDLESPSHLVRSRWDGNELIVEPEGGPIPADRDFLLSWRVAPGNEPRAAVFVEERPEGRYALILVVPPLVDALDHGLPTETLFIIDVSGSMDGPSIEQAREALLAALDRLRPGDTFDLLAFNDSNHAFRGRFLDVDEDSLDDARRWVRALHAAGGTMIEPALRRGIDAIRDRPTDRIRRIVFLTDGAVGNEAELLAGIESGLGGASLHTVGIGSAPNRYLMRKMAERGRGICAFVSGTGGAENAIDAFFRRIDRPAMTDLSLAWEGITPIEVYPSRLPDLHQGEPLVLSAWLPPGSDTGRVTLSGRLPYDTLDVALDLQPGAPEGSGVAIRWARAKVGALMDSLHEGAEQDEVRRSVIRVATAFMLVTRYTSLVAVEEFPSAWDEARRANLPNGLPAGSKLVAQLPLGGTSAPLLLLIAFVLLVVGTASFVLCKVTA
jgi:Ca-activated chloride channel family protein